LVGTQKQTKKLAKTTQYLAHAVMAQ
jgi:hypothetical protein